jgi:hypothetical protein
MGETEQVESESDLW